MGLEAIYRKPKRANTSNANSEHKKFPYLLKGLTIDRPNQVWCTDITYIKLKTGWTYLMAVMDWSSRKIISWGLSNTMDVSFCVEVLEEALKYGKPEIFNTDQGSQYTSSIFTDVLKREGIEISMDGKGRYLDNILIERLWRTVKYEHIFINDYETISETREGLRGFIDQYNSKRLHQALEYQTPDEVWAKCSL
jgi:putative transposase